MATSYTSLLGLALPVTGELAGTWGDTVNNSITSLLDTAIAGTTTLSTDADVTLSTTTGASNQARQAILLCSGARTAQRTITAPAQSKIYAVVNNTTGGFAVKIVGAGPTTGVTVANGKTAIVIWNGSDFVEVAPATATTATNLAGGAAGSVPYQTGAGVTTFLSLGTAAQVLQVNAGATAPEWVSSTGTGNVVRATSPTIATPTFTTSATFPLHIGGTGTTSTLTLRSTSGVGTTGADIIFQTGNNGATEAMRILNSGNVGIGTAAPSAMLTVASSALIDGLTVGTGGQTNSTVVGNSATVTSTNAVAIGNAAAATAAGGVAVGQNSAAGNVGVALGRDTSASSSSVALGYGAIAYTNSVAIGRNATSTNTQQVVFGSDTIPLTAYWLGQGVSSATPSAVTILPTAASGTDIAGVNLNLYGGYSTGSGAGGAVVFGTSAAGAAGTTLRTATERMRITSAGRVGIGTTTPATALELSGTTNTTFIGTASITGTTLDVTSVSSGTLAVGDRIFGAGIDFNTVVTALGTGTGGTGTYTINNSQTVASGTVSAFAASANVFRITDTDTSSAAVQPIGAIEFYGSDSGTPGAGVKGYLSLIAETTAPDTAMIFGTSDNTASTLAVERMRINSTGTVFIGNGETMSTPTNGLLSATGGLGTDIAGATLTIRGGQPTGSGAGGPIVFSTAAAGASGTTLRTATERMRIDTSGNVLVTGVGGLGYGTGSGGAVTQATSRTTGVTLNKTNGAITLVSAAGTTSYQTFTVTNSTVAATDVVFVCQKSGTDKYILSVTNVAAGSFQITFATTGGTTTEQPVFSFAVVKAVTA
ncbi:MAG: YapH protein [Bacteroidota bacterium]|jgi:hypothetical protein